MFYVKCLKMFEYLSYKAYLDFRLLGSNNSNVNSELVFIKM